MKYSPFRLLALILIIIIAVPSCSKNKDDDKKYYFKYKENGSLVTWENASFAQTYSAASNMMIFNVLGSKNLPNTSSNEAVSIIILNPGNSFPAGSYSTTTHSMEIGYHVVADPSTPTPPDWVSDDAPGEPFSQYTVIITSINNKEVRGTFTGNYLYNSTTNNVNRITEGEFYAPYYEP
jgi:hypothetical protein